MNTGTKAAWIAASANRLRTRFGTWNAIVKADIGPVRRSSEAATISRTRPGDPRERGGEREQRRRARQPPAPGRCRRLGAASLGSATRAAGRADGPHALRAASSRDVGHGRPRYHPRSRNGQHRLTEKAERPLRCGSGPRTAASRARSRRTSSASRAAVAAGDAAAADTEHRELVSRIDKAVQKGALHRNNGARKKARAARVRAGAAS